jgi:hypothetical protein
MPYPESCPECGGAFRNTGTHFTARRNEIGRHVLLELGCQNTTRRFWWDFTTGSLTQDGRPSPIRRAVSAAGMAAATNGVHHPAANGHIVEITGHTTTLSTLDPPAAESDTQPDPYADTRFEPEADPEAVLDATQATLAEAACVTGADRESVAFGGAETVAEGSNETVAKPQEETLITEVVELPGPPPVAAALLKDAFVRQLQLDRLTLRQMRSWLMSDEARRAIEVAAGATEATYERLALILFGVDLPQLLGKQAAAPTSTGMSAEERLELQREKARIRARLRRAATKAARQQN